MAHIPGGSGKDRTAWEIQRNRGKFCAVRWIGDKRERRSLGTGDPNEARRALADLIRIGDMKAADGPLTVAEIIDRYIADQAAEKHERFTWRYSAVKEHFGQMLPGHVNKAACQIFERARKAASLSPWTIHTDLTCLRTALNWAKIEAEVWIPETPDPRDYRLMLPDIAKLESAAAGPHIKLFIRLATATAGRAGAILQLTWARVDLEDRMINLRDPLHTESRKRRATVPINDGLYAALVSAKAAALTAFVVEFRGGPIKSVKRSFAAAAIASGFPEATPHILRHSAACIMMESGAPIEKVSQYLGHSDIRITQKIYARYAPTYLKDASNALDF